MGIRGIWENLCILQGIPKNMRLRSRFGDLKQTLSNEWKALQLKQVGEKLVKSLLNFIEYFNSWTFSTVQLNFQKIHIRKPRFRKPRIHFPSPSHTCKYLDSGEPEQGLDFECKKITVSKTWCHVLSNESITLNFGVRLLVYFWPMRVSH